jgi:hypothetical protein
VALLEPEAEALPRCVPSNTNRPFLFAVVIDARRSIHSP